MGRVDEDNCVNRIMCKIRCEAKIARQVPQALIDLTLLEAVESPAATHASAGGRRCKFRVQPIQDRVMCRVAD